MDSVRTLIVGAGVTGLATAAALSERGDDDYVVLEADREIGGWCKTVKKEGFVWDYSGHFFHFKHPEIERWLVERMPVRASASSRRRASSPTRGASSISPSRRTSTSSRRTSSSTACTTSTSPGRAM
jgi:protoporphyrinogen oxidase